MAAKYSDMKYPIRFRKEIFDCLKFLDTNRAGTRVSSICQAMQTSWVCRLHSRSGDASSGDAERDIKATQNSYHCRLPWFSCYAADSISVVTCHRRDAVPPKFSTLYGFSEDCCWLERGS